MSRVVIRPQLESLKLVLLDEQDSRLIPPGGREGGADSISPERFSEDHPAGAQQLAGAVVRDGHQPLNDAHVVLRNGGGRDLLQESREKLGFGSLADESLPHLKLD